MFDKIGFSYIGFIYVMLLMIPNVIWAIKDSNLFNNIKENKLLSFLEKTGQILIIIMLLTFLDFNLQELSFWYIWLIMSSIFMIMYECWWIRYFKSKNKKQDFYSNFIGIPLPGAVLPIISFLFLGIYGKSIIFIIITIVFAISHIGLHINNKKNMK